jgi:hypothetical protein
MFAVPRWASIIELFLLIVASSRSPIKSWEIQRESKFFGFSAPSGADALSRSQPQGSLFTYKS